MAPITITERLKSQVFGSVVPSSLMKSRPKRQSG